MLKCSVFFAFAAVLLATGCSTSMPLAEPTAPAMTTPAPEDARIVDVPEVEERHVVTEEPADIIDIEEEPPVVDVPEAVVAPYPVIEVIDLDDDGTEVHEYALQPIAHAGVGARVTASSTQRQFEGEGPVESLVDGDLSTRWSSAYSEPQQIELTLKEPLDISAVRLHWETASAQDYDVSVSYDGETWTEVATVTSEEPGPRVDKVELGGEKVLSLKFDLRSRVNPEWGFSLFEIELIAD